MLPNNYGQSGLPQSQPQPGPQQGMSNMGGVDQRMWIQQQQQLAQLRVQQQGNGGQLNPQVGRILRSVVACRTYPPSASLHHTQVISIPIFPITFEVLVPYMARHGCAHPPPSIALSTALIRLLKHLLTPV